jgi:HEAT repeat protein
VYLWSPLPRTAAAALRDAAHAKASVRLSAVADLARAAAREESVASVDRLIELVERDADVEVRAMAALALADADARRALPVLMRAAAAGEPRVQQMALVALGELAEPGDPDVTRVLESAFESEAPALRFQALVAAGRLTTHAELSAWLARALDDAEGKLRYIACRIIEERFFADPEVDEQQRRAWEARLVACLDDAELDVALAAALLLAPRGVEAARTRVVDALNRRRSFPQAEDEQAAIELCAELGLHAARPGLYGRAFGGVLGGGSALAFQARVALARLGDERARRHILRGLSSFRRSVRVQSIAAAGLARLEAARPRLLELRSVAREADRQSVADALQALDR